jgi:type IV secretory pathway TraG/TraD family ATPase VirD4
MVDEPLPRPLSVPDRDLWDADRRRREELRRRELERELHEARRELDRRAEETNWELERRLKWMGRYGLKKRPYPAADGEMRGGGGPFTVEAEHAVEAAVGIAAMVLAVPVLIILATGHLSALVFDGSVPHYALTDVPHIFEQLSHHLSDPGRAWDDVNTGGRPPGPVAWWGTLVALVLPLAWGGYRVAHMLLDHHEEQGQFATWRDVQQMATRRPGDYQVVVGTNARRKLVVKDLHSLLLLGPAHSGKTSGVVVPALLEWPGPAVVASNKGHVIHETIGWRSRLGEVHVFDPSATGRYPRSGWSPLATCGTWTGAIRTARDLTLAAKASIGAENDHGDLVGIVHSDLWGSSMATALAPYLLAAASSGRSMTAAAEWIEKEEHQEVLEILRPIDREAVRAHEATFVRQDPVRSAFFHVMYQILSVYKDPVAAASSDRHEIIANELLDGANTLYLSTPEYDQARFRPLCSTILRQVLTAAYDRSTSRGESMDPPLLLLMDEAVGVAPVVELARLASTASSRGVQLVSVFQDFRQIEDEYGATAGLIVKNHRAKLLMSGSQYIDAARDDRQLLRPKLGQHLEEGEAALFYGNAPPVRLRLRYWFKDRELTRRGETPQDVLPPPDPSRSRSAIDQSQALQVQAWMGREAQDDDDTAEEPLGPLGRVDPTRSFADLFGSHEDDNMLPENVSRMPRRRGERRHDR